MVEQLAQDYPDRFAPVTMHVNDDGFDVPWGQERLDVFYGIPAAAPTFMVDALWNCQASDYRYYVEQQMNQTTDITLELTANQVQSRTWDVTARVCFEGGGSRPVRVYTAATLDHHPDLQRYSTNVLMQDVFESFTNLSGGGCRKVTTRITFDSLSMANSSDIVVISWVQKPSSSAPTQVYQAGIMRWPFPEGNQLTKIEVTPDNVNLTVGEQIEFTARGEDQFGDDIHLVDPTWSLGPTGSGSGSLDPGSGSATTTFTATIPGSRQVFCQSDGITGAAIVTIHEPPRLTTIEIDPSSITVDVAGQISFSAMGVDQYGGDYPLTDPQWSVNGDGEGNFEPTSGETTTFTATYPGDCVVTCSQDDLSATAQVSIEGEAPMLTNITLSPASAETRVGEELDLTATGSDQYGHAYSLVNPAWRLEGGGDGHFDPATGSATTTFTATTAGSARAICTDDGVEGTATLEIAARGLPAPRKARGRVTP